MEYVNILYVQEVKCIPSQVHIEQKHLRKITYNKNRKNSRGRLGKIYSRKTTTMRPITKETRCKFGFFIEVDDYGFYFVPTMGTSHHNNHSRLGEDEIPYPTRLLSQDTLKVLENLTLANANLGVAVNFTYRICFGSRFLVTT